MLGVMEKEEKKSKKARAVRLDDDLDERLNRLKASEHPLLPEAPFLNQAIRFYLDAAEKCGIDSNTLRPECEIQCKPKKKQDNHAHDKLQVRHSRSA